MKENWCATNEIRHFDDYGNKIQQRNTTRI